MSRRTTLVSTAVFALLVGSVAAWFTSAAAVESEPARGEPSLAVNRARAGKLKTLHKKMSRTAPGDWLASHPERGQTFEQYRRSNPNRPNLERTKLYIQYVGEFSDEQQQIVAETGDFLRRFYGLEVKSLPPLPLKSIPDSARRVHPTWGDNQLLTSHILNQVLKPRRPKDAVAVLGLTVSDLWPGEGWNFVFGEANLTERVGVWSLYRNGDPAASDESYKLCLRRSLKVATHETGHMLGIAHCTAFQCGMNGSNNQQESDRQPLFFCPECTQKIWWACGLEPAKHFESLLEFAEKHELADEADFCKECLNRLK